MNAKILFIVASTLLFFTRGNSFGQVYTQGSIQAGFGCGFALGGASIKVKDSIGNRSANGIGIMANFGFRAQYGLTETFSTGIYWRRESAGFGATVDDTTAGTIPDVSYSGTAIGLEAQYHGGNTEGISFYGSFALGLNSGYHSYYDPSFGDRKTSLDGINAALGIGFNWYFFKEVLGLSSDLAYQWTNLGGTQDATDYEPSKDILVKSQGVYLGIGITAQFGGK